MTDLIARLLSRAGDLTESEPILALALGGALLAVFLTQAFGGQTLQTNPPPTNRFWTIAGHVLRVLRVLTLVMLLAGVMAVLRNYLNHQIANFRATHGRVSETNYEAVQTIWGPEQVQTELVAEFGYDEEVTERVEFDDPTKPAMLKKKTVHQVVPCNPFVGAKHEVTLRQNPRKKGSAVYPGYETDCRFTYRLKYTGDRDVKATLRFPLPSGLGMYDDLVVNLNGSNTLDQVQLRNGNLWLGLDVQKGWQTDLEVAFKSRGVALWYFQVGEARVIRDFNLTLHLPDLPKDELNYPEGCMTPTEIKVTGNGAGCDLAYRLGQALSNKGMGIALSQPRQPGETMSAMLAQTISGWMLVFSAVLLGFALTGTRHIFLVTGLLSTAAALGYGLLSNFHDIVFGFWGSAVVILVPIYALLAWFVLRVAPSVDGKLIAIEMIMFGVIYPCAAGLDWERRPLYLNLAASLFLAVAAWQLTRRLRVDEQRMPNAVASPAAS